MGRLCYTPAVAYAADVNDLAAALAEYDAGRTELLDAIFGPPDPDAPAPVKPGPRPPPAPPPDAKLPEMTLKDLDRILR